MSQVEDWSEGDFDLEHTALRTDSTSLQDVHPFSRLDLDDQPNWDEDFPEDNPDENSDEQTETIKLSSAAGRDIWDDDPAPLTGTTHTSSSSLHPPAFPDHPPSAKSVSGESDADDEHEDMLEGLDFEGSVFATLPAASAASNSGIKAKLEAILDLKRSGQPSATGGNDQISDSDTGIAAGLIIDDDFDISPSRIAARGLPSKPCFSSVPAQNSAFIGGSGSSASHAHERRHPPQASSVKSSQHKAAAKDHSDAPSIPGENQRKRGGRRGKRGKPALIRPLGAGATPAQKTVKGMRWNAHALRWEGNEGVLRDFDQVIQRSTRPALISQMTGSSTSSALNQVAGYSSPLSPESSTLMNSIASGARVVGDMLFDPIQMRWIPKSGDEEEDTSDRLTMDEIDRPRPHLYYLENIAKSIVTPDSRP
uniref:Uncharacterized protein n=1 Tax=Kalmanozyma brasiliensis (strain GHG001) TaxID=1365824 RepID=V5E4R0_KALBG